MTVDYIIIGQGISGTWLSYYLLKENKKVAVLDKKDLQSASNVASGLINPVTGRRVVTTWMAEELLPFVWNEYTRAGTEMNESFISQKNILVFPPAPDLHNAFTDRMKEQNSYIQLPVLQREILMHYFNFPFDVFEITPCYVIEMQAFLSYYRKQLENENMLSDEVFDESMLVIKEDKVEYGNITAEKIIYANGIAASNSKYWKNLPFVQNKGQALIIEAGDLNKMYVYKFGHLTLIPFKDDLWWVGSSNELSFTTTEPTEDFKQKTISSLKSILKKNFTVKEHWSSLRPATVERRPFIGFHPLYKQIGILNGMGSKGCSLAPWFAKELAKNIISERPINPLANVKRFSRLLGVK